MSEVSIKQTEKLSASLEKPQVINGAGVRSIEQTQTSTEDNGVNIVTIYLTDGTSKTFEVRNGSKGSAGTGESVAFPSVDEVLSDMIASDIVPVVQDSDGSILVDSDESIILS